MRGADSIDSADSLHDSRRVPGQVVINQQIGAVKIDALRQHVGWN